MRFAIPLLAALAMITLVACGGDDETAAAPLPVAQRFVTAEDAPGSKPDPVELRQTTEDFDEFIAALSELSIDPDMEEMTAVFEDAGFKGSGVDTRFFGETHRPGPRRMSSVRLPSLSLKTGRRAHSIGLKRTLRSHAL